MFYVYVFKSIKDGNNYIGSTNDLRRRLQEHNSGESKSTKPRAPFEFRYYEAYTSEREAKDREFRLKKDGRALSQLRKRIEKSLL